MDSLEGSTSILVPIGDLLDAKMSEEEHSGDEQLPHSRASFSMAQALSMYRRRQDEQQRLREEEEKKLEEEKKERARAKRKRRRQNQKIAKARAKEEAVEDETVMELAKSDSLSSAEDQAKACSSIEERVHQKRELDTSGVSLEEKVVRKRQRRESGPIVSENPEPTRADQIGETSNSTSRAIRQFIPRALMVKKGKR